MTSLLHINIIGVLLINRLVTQTGKLNFLQLYIALEFLEEISLIVKINFDCGVAQIELIYLQVVI